MELLFTVLVSDSWCSSIYWRKKYGELPRGSQRQKTNQLTFMLPSRLARSMTRNFLMRSLGRGKRNSPWIHSCTARLWKVSSHSLMRTNCQSPSNTVKMTNVSSPEAKGDEGWLCELCSFDNVLIEGSECCRQRLWDNHVTQTSMWGEWGRFTGVLCWQTQSVQQRFNISHPTSCWHAHKYSSWMLRSQFLSKSFTYLKTGLCDMSQNIF